MGNYNLVEVQHLKKYFKVASGTLHAVDDVTCCRVKELNGIS